MKKTILIKRIIPLIVFILFAFVSFVYATEWNTNSKSNFDEGIYNQTFYNDSGFVQLNATYTTGNYTSKIFDTGGSSTWNNISWWRGYGFELPNYKAEENYVVNSANMSGNVLLMHMNEASGTIVDYSGEGNNGTNNGALYSQSGKLNNALGFDGSDDYVNVSDDDSLDITDAQTVSFWAYLDPDDAVLDGNIAFLITKSDLVSANGGFYIDWDDRGGASLTNGVRAVIIHAHLDYSKIYINNAISSAGWYHIVMTYDKDLGGTEEHKLYINSVKEGASDYDRTILANDFSVKVGGGGSTGRFFSGEIDELAIFNRSLSSTEISNIYQRGLAKLDLNLTVQNCSSANCDDGTWQNINDNSPQDLNLESQYFQYKYNFETDNTSYSPELYNVSLDYTDTTPPTIQIQSPTNTTYSSSTIWFNASADEAVDTWIVNYNGTNTTLPNINSSLEVEDGAHHLLLYANDSSGNMGLNDSIYFSVDTIFPTLVWETPTPTDGEIRNYNYSYLNTTITDSTETSAWFDWNKSLVGYWGFDYYNSTGVYDNSSYCYDNETEILTLVDVDCDEVDVGDENIIVEYFEDDYINVPDSTSNKKCYKQEWKLFSDLKDEKVMTLNPKTHEKEWQLPMEKQVFDYDDEMFKIELEDGSELLVSPEHKVYVKENQNLYPNDFKVSTKSFVSNISILDCCLNSSSSDQIGKLKDNASAKYGSSFVCLLCGESLLASDINSSYSFFETGSTLRKSNENKNEKDNSLILPYFMIFSLSDINSLKANSGEINSQPKFGNSSIILLRAESLLKKENKIDASIIKVLGNFIFYDLATLSLSSEPHFNANSSVILEFFNNSSATLNINLSDTLSFNALENTKFTSSLPSSLNPDFNSSGIDIVTSSIEKNNNSNYINLSEELICLVVMPKENEDNFSVLFINSEFQDEALEDVDTSFSSKIISEGFVMCGVEDYFIDFFCEDFFKNRVFSGCFFNDSLAFWQEDKCITHFNESKNSSAELYVLPVGVSFNAFFNSSMCSGLGGSSSTGCQSIFSQNSQSSSVTSLVCANLSDMSRFINLTKAPTSNLESNLSSGLIICSINKTTNLDYLNLSEELICFVVMPKSFENDNIFFDLESEDKTSNLNSFVVAEISPEIFIVLNRNFITQSNLIDFLLNSSEQSEIFSFEFLQDFFDTQSVNSHIDSHQLLNSSIVMGSEGSFLASFNSLIKDFFMGNSSIGYQPILSQNSWLSSDNVPVLMNFSNMSCLISLITASTNNLESNLSSDLINCSINKDKNKDYLNFSLQPVTEVYSEINSGKNIYFLNAENKPVRVKSITKEKYNEK